MASLYPKKIGGKTYWYYSDSRIIPTPAPSRA